MPFIRHGHDKRGYDSTFVLHAYRNNAGVQRTKVLYFFRSPSHVQVGRKALDPEVREALEHTHPDLTFDWNGLLRDAPPVQRHSRPDQPHARDHRAGRGARSAKQGRPERVAPPPPEVPDDDSPLGQAVGASDALRLRQRYAELVQRVGRRARTPEDRDRLSAELALHNPDMWQGADTIRQLAGGVAPIWDAIAAQLPKRRRGRRGGRGDEPDQSGDSDVIIGEREHTDDAETYDHADPVRTAGDRDLERPAGEPTPDGESGPAAAADVHEPG